MRHRLLPLATTLTLLSSAPLGLAGCDGAAPAPAAPAVGAPHAVPNYDDSKADNYISTNAREYVLSGVAHAALPADFATRDAEGQAQAIEAAVGQRLRSVASALRSHVEAVVRDGNASAADRWFSFFKRGAGEAGTAEVLQGGAQVRFTFALELVGSYYLMSQLAPETTGARTFNVTVSGDIAPLTVTVAGSDSRDAFPRYDALFEDGVYDLAVHFGGDYNSERFDLETARWLVDALLEGGWHNPSVTDFDSLTIDSPPFTRTLTVEGRAIEARVRVFHSDLVEGAEEGRLSAAMRDSLATADVVLYSGHAGPGAGFILDYQPRHEIPARDFASLPLASKYQIYVFDGCQTYRTYVDDLLANPLKSFDNVDIVTTVNTTPFSVGYQTIHEFLYWLTLTDDGGRHFPVSWTELLRGLNTRDFADVHYGVHGIDQDPQLNPHAHADIACQPCASDLDCGAGGNLCLSYGAGAGCGVACTTDAACGAGYRCARLFDDPALFYIPKQCVRRDYACP